MERLWIGVGALGGFGAVGMAAYAAHGLPGRLDEAGLGLVQTAVQMQLWHALALVATGIWSRGSDVANVAGAAFALGMVLFCGSLYALALGGVQPGLLAPIGGALLMVGWLLLALSALRRRR